MNTAVILAVLISLFFLVMVGMSYKTWKWFHIMAAILVYGSTLPVVVFTSMALKSRIEWSKYAAGLEKKVQEQTAAADVLRMGNPDQANPDPLTFVRGGQGEVFRILLNRGRVWRQCQLTNVNPQAGTLKFSTQPPPPGEQGPNRLEKMAVLYVFKEVSVPNVYNGEPRWVPAVYVGEFQVSDTTEIDITAAPTLPLDQQQASHLVVSPDVRWTLYEKMPTDTPEAFASLNEEQIRSLLPNVLNVDAQRHEAFVQSYLRDGKDPLETDPPARRWVEVEFLVEHTETVDSTTTQVDRDSRYFDDQGRALPPGLRAGGPVKFAKQQKAIFPQAKADELINAGTCKKVRDVFRRELKDYAANFHEIAVRMNYLSDRIGEVTRQTEVLVEAQKKAQKQIDYRTQEKAKLEQDLAKFQAEGAAVTAYAKQLEAAVNATRARANELFKSNLALSTELADLQKRLADEINRRETEATSTR